MVRFEDRISGAGELVPKLAKYKGKPDAVVVGLPRGGMITANYLSEKLNLPLDFIIVKKVGALGKDELAIGAVTEKGDTYFDEDFARLVEVDIQYRKDETEKKKNEVNERANIYRKNYPGLDLKNKTVILVDDGIATGTTVIAAIYAVKKTGVKELVVAVPVASTDATKKLKKLGVELITPEVDPHMSSVGEFYNNFPQVEDREVLTILENAKNNISNK